MTVGSIYSIDLQELHKLSLKDILEENNKYLEIRIFHVDRHASSAFTVSDDAIDKLNLIGLRRGRATVSIIVLSRRMVPDLRIFQSCCARAIHRVTARQLTIHGVVDDDVMLILADAFGALVVDQLYNDITERFYQNYKECAPLSNLISKLDNLHNCVI